MNKKENNGKLVFIIIFSFVIGGIVNFAILKWTPLINDLIQNKDTVIVKDDTKVYEKSSLAPAVKKVYDAVVLVQSHARDQVFSTGTGFVYKTDDKYGYILTNHHVIDGAEKVSVIFTNDKEVEVKLLSSDEYLDIAVLQVPKNEVLMVASIGSSEKTSLGDTVFTVGSPLGYDYYGSVTAGILSGKDRMVTVGSGRFNSKERIMRVLQTDAAINAGNSGGPLLNVNGEVIGICSMKLQGIQSDIDGMGFAIPIEYAINHSDTLESGKKIAWPVLGVKVINVNDKSSLALAGITLTSKANYGAAVVEVVAKSSADKGGILAGDIITAINGNKIKDHEYLRYELYQHQAGETIEITVLRNNKEKKLKVQLAKE